ncbi:hypothetical protein DXB04_09925 [Enterocloster bolteae]|nr:hypothetical protein DXB04_09925 [Enterocloster bolteae]
MVYPWWQAAKITDWEPAAPGIGLFHPIGTHGENEGGIDHSANHGNYSKKEPNGLPAVLEARHGKNQGDGKAAGHQLAQYGLDSI